MDFFQAQVKDITSIAVSSKLGENTALLCNFGEPFDVHPIRGSGGALMFSSDFRAREVFVENLHDPMQWGNPEWEFTGAIDAISKGIASERSVGNARFRRLAQQPPLQLYAFIGFHIIARCYGIKCRVFKDFCRF